MLEELIGSKTRVKLLKLFVINSSRKYYVREITRVVDEQINSVRRELAKLLKLGIIISSKEGNRVYYHANKDFPHMGPLSTLIISIDRANQPQRSDIVAQPLNQAPKTTSQTNYSFLYTDKFREIGKVELLVLGDAFNSRTSMGVDVVVVGSVNQNALDKVLSEIEDREGKTLRFSLFTWADFNYRRSVKDRFVSRIINPHATVLIDEKGIFSPR